MSSLKIANKVEDLILKGKCSPSDFDLCVKEVSDFLSQEPQKKEEVLKEFESKEKKYDKLQLANKVLMNALYGYFGATSSRFYREDIAEGITSVGQEESLRVQKLLEKEGYEILYGDTDSMFILVKGMPEEIKDNIEEAKKWIRGKFVPRINELAQKELETMARELGVKNPILDKTYHFKFKQEMIARSGIFLPSISRGDEAKKRYDLWVIDEEGVPKDKFAHAGTPLKQSKLPKIVREKFKEFLVLLLKEMKTDPEELLRPARELREIILRACEEWDIEKIGSNFQFSKPFEEYKTGKAPEFAIEWNLVCEKLDLPPYQVGGKYKFVEVKPKKDIDWSTLSEFNLIDEKKEIIKSLHSFTKKRNITSVAIVLEDDRYYLSILKAIFDLDTDRILVKYVENIFKAHLSVLNIPIEKIAFDYGEVDDLL